MNANRSNAATPPRRKRRISHVNALVMAFAAFGLILTTSHVSLRTMPQLWAQSASFSSMSLCHAVSKTAFHEEIKKQEKTIPQKEEALKKREIVSLQLPTIEERRRAIELLSIEKEELHYNITRLRNAQQTETYCRHPQQFDRLFWSKCADDETLGWKWITSSAAIFLFLFFSEGKTRWLTILAALSNVLLFWNVMHLSLKLSKLKISGPVNYSGEVYFNFTFYSDMQFECAQDLIISECILLVCSALPSLSIGLLCLKMRIEAMKTKKQSDEGERNQRGDHLFTELSTFSVNTV